MMKLYMKQKVFSWKDKFTVKDEAVQDRYFVEGEFLTLAKKLHIFDESQTEVAFIRQKLWSFMPRFLVEIDGREVCQIAKRFTMLKPKYELEGIGWHVEGDFWAHEYAVFDGDKEVMRLSKHWFTWGDSYELDIVDPKDELICLSIVLAIDAAIEMTAASGATT
jgi:Uncharacterized conserved protein